MRIEYEVCEQPSGVWELKIREMDAYDKILRGEGWVAATGVRLICVGFPEWDVDEDTLFLWGCDTALNNEMVFIEAENIERVVAAIDEWNSQQKHKEDGMPKKPEKKVAKGKVKGKALLEKLEVSDKVEGSGPEPRLAGSSDCLLVSFVKGTGKNPEWAGTILAQKFKHACGIYPFKCANSVIIDSVCEPQWYNGVLYLRGNDLSKDLGQFFVPDSEIDMVCEAIEVFNSFASSFDVKCKPAEQAVDMSHVKLPVKSGTLAIKKHFGGEYLQLDVICTGEDEYSVGVAVQKYRNKDFGIIPGSYLYTAPTGFTFSSVGCPATKASSGIGGMFVRGNSPDADNARATGRSAAWTLRAIEAAKYYNIDKAIEMKGKPQPIPKVTVKPPSTPIKDLKKGTIIGYGSNRYIMTRRSSAPEPGFDWYFVNLETGNMWSSDPLKHMSGNDVPYDKVKKYFNFTLPLSTEEVEVVKMAETSEGECKPTDTVKEKEIDMSKGIIVKSLAGTPEQYALLQARIKDGRIKIQGAGPSVNREYGMTVEFSIDSNTENLATFIDKVLG